MGLRSFRPGPTQIGRAATENGYGFEISHFEVEGLNYPSSEQKIAEQLRGYCEANLRLLFSYLQNSPFLMTRLIYER